MKNSKKFHSMALTSTAFALFFLISVSSMAFASSVPNSQLILTETQLITTESDQAWPAIYEDRMVWADNRNGNWDIYTYTLSTGQETQITANESDQDWPAIYGDRTVWADNRNGNWDIYMYDFSTQEETRITTNELDQYSPAIHEDRIVWSDNRDGNLDVYLYDLSAQEETRITTSISDQSWPAIYGDRIVWVDDRNGWEDNDIYMYDLSAQEETQITANISDQMIPSISGDRIVWQDDRNGNWDIYMHNLSTQEETRITANESNKCYPSIDGDRIVWIDDRNGNWDIYMYGLSTSNETQITTNESDQVWPAISGNRIVWPDNRNGNWDICLCTLSEEGSEPPVIPQSIGNIQASTGPDWINWTWTNPSDPAFNHTEVYLNGTFQTNTSAEHFNATGLQPETDYTLGTRTANQYGNVNETWVNSTATTGAEFLPDIQEPVIESVVLFPANTTAGSTINISANVTDNVGVAGVTAGDLQLIKIDGIWQGSITAPSTIGNYSLLINASDAAGNLVEITANYRVVTPTGSLGAGVSPKTTTAPISGKTIDYIFKIKSIQNFDDTILVNVTMEDLPESYQMPLEWFDWNNQTVKVTSNSTASLPLVLTIPPGQSAGRKAFKVKANSTTWIITAYDSGVITIS